MVNPYCTLLFSRKEIIKFSVEALVSALYNCLIGCIVITRGYRPWNTANTTADICLLTENSNKIPKQNVKFVQTFFISHLVALRATMGHWQGGSHTHPILITKLFQVWPEGHRKPRNEVGSQSLNEHISGIWCREPPILSITFYPMRHSPEKCTRNNWLSFC